MKKNFARTAFSLLFLIIFANSAYPQWVQTNWLESNDFFELYSNQDIVFAQIWDSNNGGRVFFTDDDGANWAQISSADNDIDILSLTMWDNNILAGTWNGFYRCTMDDMYWEAFEPNGIPSDTPIWSVAGIDNTFLAGTVGDIYKSSIEDINNWNKISTGIQRNIRIMSFVSNGNAILAGSFSDGIFITKNGGANWTSSNSGLTDTHISQLVTMGTKLFAVALKEGVFVSDDNGTTWVKNSSSLKNVNCLLVSNNLLFAGTDSNGVHISADSGQTWVPVNSGLPANTLVWSMTKSGDNIFASTSEGIWRINPEDINNYTITASVSEGGTISPEGEMIVYENGSRTFTITPELGYKIGDILVDGSSVGAVDSYTFSNVAANHTISVNFIAVPIYTITSSAGDGGAISPSGTTMVSESWSQEFTIAPLHGYTISEVIVDGNSVGAVSSYIFTDVTKNHTITAVFAIAPYQINCGGNESAPFSADQYYSSGSTSAVTSEITTTGVINPAPQAVYRTQRYGTMIYTLPNLTVGASYKVRLHFSENSWTAKGKRRFNVIINGVTVLSNYDIYAETGARYKAVVKEFTTTANTSGVIMIRFTTVTDNAIIGGIEIIQQ